MFIYPYSVLVGGDFQSIARRYLSVCMIFSDGVYDFSYIHEI